MKRIKVISILSAFFLILLLSSFLRAKQVTNDKLLLVTSDSSTVCITLLDGFHYIARYEKIVRTDTMILEIYRRSITYPFVKEKPSKLCLDKDVSYLQLNGPRPIFLHWESSNNRDSKTVKDSSKKENLVFDGGKEYKMDTANLSDEHSQAELIRLLEEIGYEKLMNDVKRYSVKVDSNHKVGPSIEDSRLD